MRISDWSSDVCSSDLLVAAGLASYGDQQHARILAYQATGAIEQVVDVGGVGGYPPVEVLQGGANVVVVRRGASVGAVVEHVGRACDRARGSIDCRATAQRVDHRRELNDIHRLVVGHAGGEVAPPRAHTTGRRSTRLNSRP